MLCLCQVWSFFILVLPITPPPLLGERMLPFVFTNLNLLHSRMFNVKFDLKWLRGSLNVCYITIISPWKREGSLFEQTWIYSHKKALYQFGWNWPSGSWEEDETVKSWQTDRRMDSRTDLTSYADAVKKLGKLPQYKSHTTRIWRYYVSAVADRK